MDEADLWIVTLALVFTVGSFWWLYARTGRLIEYEPHTFAAYVAPQPDGVSYLVIPLMLYNTGPVPIVVLDLRVQFPDEPGNLPPLRWIATRPGVQPRKEDPRDMAALFSVPGRQVIQRFVEVVGILPGVVPDPRPYAMTIEARTSRGDRWQRLLSLPGSAQRQKEWQPLLSYELQAGNIKALTVATTYLNDPGWLSDDEKEQARLELEWHRVNRADARRQHGL
jgi:hypothetical protein